MADYILYIALRIVVFFLRFLPIAAWLFVARSLGWAYYYVAGKKNVRACANLKLAFGIKGQRALKAILKQMYQRFAQNFMEALYLPYVDECYVRKYIRIPDKPVVEEALLSGRGIIFLGSHAGSWELSNIACAMLFSDKSAYAMLAQPQARHKRLDAFLNFLRESKKCHVIRVDELKKMVEHLTGNNMLGVVADHGGKEGIPIEFFGKPAMTPVGSVRLSRKLGSKIVLAFMRRTSGPYHEMYFKPYELIRSADAGLDLQTNLTNINKAFEHWITRYPEEYLWSYKRWKYSPQKNILVLSDGKIGHIKQSLAVVDMVRLAGFQVKSDVVVLEYLRRRFNHALSLIGLLFGARAALACLPFFFKKEMLRNMAHHCYDMVVSAGALPAVVNLAIGIQDDAKSVAVMRPGILPVGRFDIVIMPEHDRPPSLANVLVTVGSLNSVGIESIKRDFEILASLYPALNEEALSGKLKIGVLIGGNSKNYKLTEDMAAFLCGQLKKALDDLDGHLFLTTSRRTPMDVALALKNCFKNDPRVKLFVVAAEDNPQGTVGGIFYLCDIVIVSGESISMVSEAVASGKHVVVFEPRSRTENNKVRRYLNFLAGKQYIYLLKLNDIYDKLSWIVSEKPKPQILDAKSQILEGLRKIL
ncbi:MAG: ELM1/GtrOC1 family putative glycosyltransferase [Candidatus Omnitrophota bacterium]